jgi:hypothetical protein
MTGLAAFARYTADPIEDTDGALLALTVTRYLMRWPQHLAQPQPEERDWIIEVPAAEVADLLSELVTVLGYHSERTPAQPPKPALRLIRGSSPGTREPS